MGRQAAAPDALWTWTGKFQFVPALSDESTRQLATGQAANFAARLPAFSPGKPATAVLRSGILSTSPDVDLTYTFDVTVAAPSAGAARRIVARCVRGVIAEVRRSTASVRVVAASQPVVVPANDRARQIGASSGLRHVLPHALRRVRAGAAGLRR